MADCSNLLFSLILVFQEEWRKFKLEPTGLGSILKIEQSTTENSTNMSTIFDFPTELYTLMEVKFQYCSMFWW